MIKPSEAQVRAAIAEILSDTKAYHTSLNWAVNYCKAALGMSGEELRIQVLYILNNLSKWRHPEAGRIRKVLKAFAGIK